MRQVILGGAPGSGKTTSAAILRSEFRFECINVGDVLYNCLKRSGVSCTCRGEIGPVFLKYYSPEHIFALVREQLPENQDYIIDGVRLGITCRQFKEWDSSIQIWFIEMPPELRVETLRKKLNREHPSKPISAEELALVRSYDSELPDIASLADTSINNEGTLQDLADKIRRRVSAQFRDHIRNEQS